MGDELLISTAQGWLLSSRSQVWFRSGVVTSGELLSGALDSYDSVPFGVVFAVISRVVRTWSV